MLDRLLPLRIDNAYRGHVLAPWLFGLAVLMKLAIGLGCVFNGRVAAGSADGIPLDTFTAAGAQTIVALFANWGLSQVVICLLCIVVLVRYRAWIPLMFTLLLAETLGRRLVFHLLPIPRTGTPPGPAVNLAILSLMIAGLALSLWDRAGPRTRD